MWKLFAAGICSALTGCGSYSESGLASNLDDTFIGRFGISRSGVTDTPLAADAYRIRGYGNQNASFEKTNSVAMVRAAVLASEHGYDRFSIVDFATWEKSTIHSTPITAHTSTNISAQTYGGYVSGRAQSTTTFSGGETYTLDRPRTDIVVKFVPSDSREAASALRVADIISRYGRKAGLTPEEMQAALNIEPIPTGTGSPQETHGAATEVTTAALQEATKSPPAAFQQEPALTLEEIYAALSPAERARVNSLPPSQRADFLQMIRDGRY